MVSVVNIKKTYNSKTVIEDLSLSVNAGDLAVIVGPSGCGKSTLLNIIAGLDQNYEGNLQTSGQKIGYVFQEDRILPWLTVFQNIKSVNPSGEDALVQHFIDAAGLTGFEKYYPDELSGGMRQRCSIARALYYGSDILLMDEPFKSLDYVIRQKMISDLLKIHKEEKNTILFVTHDIEEALAVADTVFVLRKDPCRLADTINMKTKSPWSAEKKQQLKEKILKLIAA
ncbi:ATP-binding cassette domain-containing protein [Treponema parvum]|uniref:ATP-binding cassette domain-containing protein n=1 Tax=Treponema parvum TaxID=138851 RepID=A0A975ICB6_9SPIR|nr:ATP-binding cassette domain-containing protein [Treponema parvum]QTQ11548.1 ATP-binding cassette domain-containing protein [Treponema parvum]QTQ16505.1 ATP-binding cassette domain-containing protein [Treponema parvum]